MTWLQWTGFVAAVAVTNFVSLAIIFGVTSYMSDRRKRKVFDPILEKLESSLMDELNFMDIVRNFEQEEGRNDK
ncbi:MAG: hypothetical protein ACO38Q_02625 [Aquiluna sp.]